MLWVFLCPPLSLGWGKYAKYNVNPFSHYSTLLSGEGQKMLRKSLGGFQSADALTEKWQKALHIH